MAAINFYTNTGYDFNIDLQGSGVGFYGVGGFGYSVAVGAYQDNTYVTDGNGVVQGPAMNNVKYTHPNSGIPSTATSGLGLQAIPNYEATMNIRFTDGSAVRVQNALLYIYDRYLDATPPTHGASGVTTKVAEIIHPGVTQVNNGSGDISWYSISAGTCSGIPFANSPGVSGELAGSGSTSVATSQRHDWFTCLSSSPNTIGSKTQYGLYFQTEYL